MHRQQMFATLLANPSLKRLIKEEAKSKAISEAERAVELDPNDPEGHLAMAWAQIFAGHAEAALELREHGSGRDLARSEQDPDVEEQVRGLVHLVGAILAAGRCTPCLAAQRHRLSTSRHSSGKPWRSASSIARIAFP